MKRILLTTTVLLVLIPMVWAQSAAPASPPPPPGQQEDQSEEIERIRQALDKAVALQVEDNLAFLVNRIEAFEVKLSAGQTFAVLYLAMVDPETGGPRTSEPGLAFAVKDESGEWSVTLPADPEWSGLLDLTPPDLLPEQHKDYWRETNQVDRSPVPEAPFTGYRLPWQHGVSRNLSQSTEHDRYTPSGSAHYSFDFYDPDVSEKMWDLYAAKGGTVWLMKEDVPTCYQYTCSGFQPLGNYIILKDTTTTPTSYQLYLHLKQDSIPDYLQIGASVEQGAFIGVVDNTGQSWGSHLHYMVHTTYNSYWGQSRDIVFEDVSINGGRPRRHDGEYYFDFDFCYDDDVCETSQAAYISDNDTFKDGTLPTGGLTAPADYIEVTSASVTLTGWAADADSGIGSARFIADFEGSWKEVGVVYTTSPFSYSWNMCDSEVPDGPVSVAVRVYDRAGNLLDHAGLRRFTKNYACPISIPAPAANEVLICSEAGYQSCSSFLIGDYPDSTTFPGGLENNKAVSLRVGDDVQVTVYSEANFAARGETFFGGDDIPNLYDYLIGSNHVSSVKVGPLSDPPGVPAPYSSSSTPPFIEGDIVTLHWDNTAWADQFQPEISTTGVITTYPWQDNPTVMISGLPEGQYQWRVKAKNGLGMSTYSSSKTLTVYQDTVTLPDGIDPPITDPMDNNNSGFWSLSGKWSISGGRGWFDGKSTTDVRGDLTTDPIHIPGSGWYLRFDSYYYTEILGSDWDQRWIQISVDGGPFENIRQLYADQIETWSSSHTIDLSPYAGHDIRIRFHYDSIDQIHNYTGYGWGIDNFSVTNSPVPVCNDPDQGDSYENAAPISYGSTVSGEICPGADLDFYSFNATAGQNIMVDIDAAVDGSPLDGVLTLLDTDGKSAWASSDDEILYDLPDPLLTYRFAVSGQYYLRLVDWRYPGTGGPEFNYDLTLIHDDIKPVVHFIGIDNGDFINGALTTISADTIDSGGSGVRQVDFYLHSPDYVNDNWILLSSDRDSLDGWSAELDPAQYAEGRGYALVALARDGAGNASVTAAWNLTVDVTPPVTMITPLPPIQDSTAFRLVVQGTDNLSGIERYDILQSLNGSTWAPFYNGPHSYQWVIGQLGRHYYYQSRAADRAGNQEAFPGSAEVQTEIPASVCSHPDSYEADDTYTAAAVLLVGQFQTHNFCLTGPSGPLNDADWLVLDVTAGTHYTFQFFPTGISTAGHLELYSDPAAVPLEVASSIAFGSPVVLEFTAQYSRYYIRVEHTNPSVAGNGVSYLVLLSEGYRVVLPVVSR